MKRARIAIPVAVFVISGIYFSVRYPGWGFVVGVMFLLVALIYLWDARRR